MKHRPLLGIDASRSTRSCPTGVERYSTEIIQALLKEVKEFDLRLYTPKLIKEFPRELQRILWFPRLWSLMRLSWEMLWHKPDVLFVPAHVLPFFAPRRSFVTIHDVAFEKVPEAYGFWQRLYLRWSTKRAVRKCEKVFVPSEAVREDVLRFFGAKRVKVIPHGPLSLAPVHSVQRSTTPLFFFLGRLEAKKNLSTLLDAWAIVQKKCSGRLVLAGLPGQGYGELIQKVEQLNLSSSVDFPGFIDEEKASRFFRSATAFVYPSLDEGFGFPLLQAFSVNCPVICSDIKALCEVGGDAVLYASPKDATGFADHMISLVEDAGLGASLANRGRERLKEFTWKKAAQAVKAIFRC